MLHLNSLSIGYGTKIVATDITTHLKKGRLTCLIGRNGTGKSTLMRTIAAFQQPISGTITLIQPSSLTAPAPPSSAAITPLTSPSHVADGVSVSLSSLNPKARARLIGVVLTEKPDIQNMTVCEMVAMGRAPYTGFFGRLSSEDNAIIDEAIALVGMSAFSDRAISTLSDGERQKVMIAKALAQQTPLIFLDEPTAFLDYPSKVDTMHMLQRLCHEQGKTVLLSTHDLDVSLALCDDIWLMQDHKLLTGTTETLSTEISTFMKK